MQPDVEDPAGDQRRAGADRDPAERLEVVRARARGFELTERAGVWIDMKDAYWTLDNTYVESVWWMLGQLWEKGLLYEGYRVSPYCARCGTAKGIRLGERHR